MIIVVLSTSILALLVMQLLRWLHVSDDVYWSWVIPVGSVAILIFVVYMIYSIVTAASLLLAVINIFLLALWCVWIFYKCKKYSYDG